MSLSLSLSLQERTFFYEMGYLVIENMLSPKELEEYTAIYNRFLSGDINTGKNRSDLGAGLGDGVKEAITQIMWPSDFVPKLLDMPYHIRMRMIAKELLGPDIEMDFDMLINKAPFTNTETPWHQDAAYWINMPDKRAFSSWLALDNATIDNGCMWYIPGSHLQPIRPHRFAGAEGGALMCDGKEEEGVCVPLQPGACVIHQGGTLHYSRGNTSPDSRRAFIINFRPQEMIDLERKQGFDHGRNGNSADRKPRNTETK